MGNEQLQDKIRSRRTHRKSRLGCGNCKKRRIKCDERKPECRNCLQHTIHCDFQPSQAQSSSEGLTPPQKYQFKQSKYSLAIPSNGTPEKNTSTRSIGVQCTTPSFLDSTARPSDGISLRDLHLFHHFTLSTSLTFGDETTDPHQVWRVHVPQWGLSFRSILHLLLTLSALHLASSEDSDKKDEYIGQAAEHFTFGVRSVTSVLALDTLDSGNCQQIYIAAVMICFAYFARGPRGGEYLVFNEKGKSEWLVLLHGVRAILGQKHAEIFTGVLEPSQQNREAAPNPELDAELARHMQRLQGVKAMVAAEAGADREVFARTIDDLVKSFEEAYQARKARLSGTMLMPFTMGWTFRLPELMIERLEGREPIALVILAHWAILLRYMRDAWFMRGWDQHIILGIRDCLPGAYHAWIEWPEEVICSELYNRVS
ncbi:hypothetical protein BDV18DRAFT_109667 [Aspergillus unguis]